MAGQRLTPIQRNALVFLYENQGIGGVETGNSIGRNHLTWYSKDDGAKKLGRTTFDWFYRTNLVRVDEKGFGVRLFLTSFGRQRAETIIERRKK